MSESSETEKRATGTAVQFSLRRLERLADIVFAFALGVTPPEIGATTVSYVFAWNQTFSAISPLIGGFLTDAFGTRSAMYFIAGLTLTAALISGTLKEGHSGSVLAFFKRKAKDRS